MEEKYQATIILHSLGDIIGYKNGDWEFNHGNGPRVPFTYVYEILSEYIDLGGINHLNITNWSNSDDTVMHLATANALIEESSTVDKTCKNMAKHYIKEFNSSDMKNKAPGIALTKYIKRLSQGNSWDSTPYDKSAGGSGASMRCSCIGLAFHGIKNREKLIKYSLEISRMTHNNGVGFLGGITAALFTAFALEDIHIYKWPLLLIKHLESDFLENYIKNTRGYKDYNYEKYQFIDKWKSYNDDKFINDQLKNKPTTNLVHRNKYYYTSLNSNTFSFAYIGSGGDSSVIIAYDCLVDSGNNWEKLLIYSMLHTGDTDTTGCIAGSWYGALYGFKDVPKHFLQQIQGYKKLSQTASKMYSKFMK